MATLKRRDWLKHAALSALVGSVGIPSVGAQPVAPRAKRILYLFMAGAPSQLTTSLALPVSATPCCRIPCWATNESAL